MAETPAVEIDPLTAVLSLFHADARLTALVGTRIASRHRFRGPSTTAARPVQGEAWPNKAKAVQLRYETGGPFDLYTTNQTPRLDCWCFGEDEREAAKVYLAIVTITRYKARRVVATSLGNALVYWLNIDGTPQTLWEENVQLDYIQIYLAPRVAERAVP